MKIVCTLKYAQAQDLLAELIRPFDQSIDNLIGWLSKPRDKELLRQTYRRRPNDIKAILNNPKVEPQKKEVIRQNLQSAGIAA